MADPYADFGLVYEQRRRAAQGQRDAILSSNAYSRTLAQQRGQRDLLDYGQRQTSHIPTMATSFLRRGLSHSGLYQQAQNDFASQWSQGNNDIMSALKQKLDQYSLADSSASSQYDTTAADLEGQKLRDILATASALQGYKSIGG